MRRRDLLRGALAAVLAPYVPRLPGVTADGTPVWSDEALLPMAEWLARRYHEVLSDTSDLRMFIHPATARRLPPAFLDRDDVEITAPVGNSFPLSELAGGRITLGSGGVRTIVARSA